MHLRVLLNHIVSYSVDKNGMCTPCPARDLDNESGTPGTTGYDEGSVRGIQRYPDSDQPQGRRAIEVANGVAHPLSAAAGYDCLHRQQQHRVHRGRLGRGLLDDYEFSVYTGVKNVPDIEGMTTTVEGKQIPAKVDVAADRGRRGQGGLR